MIAAPAMPELVSMRIQGETPIGAQSCEVCHREIRFTYAEVDDFRDTVLLGSHRYCLDCLVWLMEMV